MTAEIKKWSKPFYERNYMNQKKTGKVQYVQTTLSGNMSGGAI